MTDQPQTSIGTVAEEAARLISAVAAMAQSTTTAADAATAYDPSPYAGEPAQDPASPVGAPTGDPGPGAPPVCSACGGVNDGTPVACKLCPLCQGIALMRSVRPETVDRLADFASAVAATLRDMATQSRSSGPGSGSGAGSGAGSGSGSGTPSDGPKVQDIRVDDGDER